MGYVTEESYVLHTKAGETRVTFLNEQGDLMRVDMGYPEFVAKEIPVVGFEGEIVNEAIFFGDNFYNATCVSLGLSLIHIDVYKRQMYGTLHLDTWTPDTTDIVFDRD